MKSMKSKWYQNWFIHNMISHPLSEVVYQLAKRILNDSIAEEWCGKIHDATVPIERGNGRG